MSPNPMVNPSNPPTSSGAHSRPASPCSPLSESESTSSENSASKWTPGVYVPIHRRGGSRSSTTTSVSSSSCSPKPSRANFPLASSYSKVTTNSHSWPRARKYTRAELLSLAPTSLVQASLHPIITPQLVAKHPRILRVRGEGVFRALEMARQDLYRDYFPSEDAWVNVSVHANATTNDSEMRLMQSCAPETVVMPFYTPTSPGSGGPPQPDPHPAPTLVPGPSPSSDPYHSPSPSPSPPPVQSQLNKTGRRARGKRVRYQRNFVSAPGRADDTVASRDPSSPHPTMTVAAALAPNANATASAIRKRNDSSKRAGDTDANFPKNPYFPNRANRFGSWRQVKTRAPARDESISTSWRTPLNLAQAQAQSSAVAA